MKHLVIYVLVYCYHIILAPKSINLLYDNMNVVLEQSEIVKTMCLDSLVGINMNKHGGRITLEIGHVCWIKDKEHVTICLYFVDESTMLK